MENLQIGYNKVQLPLAVAFMGMFFVAAGAGIYFFGLCGVWLSGSGTALDIEFNWSISGNKQYLPQAWQMEIFPYNFRHRDLPRRNSSFLLGAAA